MLHFLVSFHGHMKNEYPWPHRITAQSTVFLMKKKKRFWKRSLLTCFQQTGDLMGHKRSWGTTGFLQYYWFHAVARQLTTTLRTTNWCLTCTIPKVILPRCSVLIKLTWKLVISPGPSRLTQHQLRHLELSNKGWQKSRKLDPCTVCCP